MRHFPAPAREYLPAYKITQYATRDKLLDLVDNYPPMYATEIYPGPKDYKAQKLTFTFTSFPAGKPTTFFKHNLDLPQAISLFTMMRYGDQGDPTRKNMLRGFPDMKGYPDPMHKEWERTSHIFDVKYVTQVQDSPLRTGPNYALSFTYGPGTVRMVNGKAGIVMPTAGAQTVSASIMIPIFGNADTKPYAVYFAEQALAYIQAREACRPISASGKNPRRQCTSAAATAALVATRGRGRRAPHPKRAHFSEIKGPLTPRMRGLQRLECRDLAGGTALACRGGRTARAC